MRRIIPLIFLLLCCVWPAGSPLAQNFYKSVGPDGKISYSDRPPAEGRSAKAMKFDNLPSSTLPASASTYVEQLKRLQASMVTKPSADEVILYSAVWCTYCKVAKNYLTARGIAYQEFDIDSKEGMASFANAGGGKSVPLLLAAGQRVQGFSAGAYDALFANRK
jgi:glutaredoxin